MSKGRRERIEGRDKGREKKEGRMEEKNWKRGCRMKRMKDCVGKETGKGREGGVFRENREAWKIHGNQKVSNGSIAEEEVGKLPHCQRE